MRWLNSIGIPASALLVLAACGPSDSDFVAFDTYHSPDDEHRVIVEMAPKNSFAFSPEAIRIYIAGHASSERQLLTKTSLANDGSRITDKNIRAEWIDAATVRLCFSGAEQDDEAIVIDVVAASFAVESAKCTD